MQGWIKVHRKLIDSGIWKKPAMLKLWMYCLMKATHKKTKTILDMEEVELQEGEFITGRDSLAEDFNKGMNKEDKKSAITLWRWMKNFEKWEMLNIRSTNKYSIVTVLNWDEYQENEQQMNIQRTSDEQPMNTNKNAKNAKNDKNIQQQQQGEPDFDYEPPEPTPEYDQKENPFTMYEYCYGKFPGQMIIGDINHYIDQEGMEQRLIAFAIWKAAKNDANFGYARGILQNWVKKNIRTYDDALQEGDQQKSNNMSVIKGGREDHAKVIANRDGSYSSDISKYDFSKTREL